VLPEWEVWIGDCSTGLSSTGMEMSVSVEKFFHFQGFNRIIAVRTRADKFITS
jgi:hypothetical protein